ncbi:hypothetical protein [Desulfonema ishimotonii]|nr:hypothetical protein [Desulfonema ishimotonii]
MNKFIDNSFYNVVANATRDGIEIINQQIGKRKYICTYFNWQSLSYDEEGFPSFSENLLSGPSDYGKTFSISNQAEINSFRFLTLPLILMWAWIFLREVISAQCLSLQCDMIS